MSELAVLGLWVTTQLSISEGLLGDHLLASFNQCRALHAELRVLDLPELRRVEREPGAESTRWRALDAKGREVGTLERRRVQVDGAAGLGEARRLSPLREQLTRWSSSVALEPRIADRRGNVFAWTAKQDGGLVCVVYRPEKDELERTWIALSVLVDPRAKRPKSAE